MRTPSQGVAACLPSILSISLTGSLAQFLAAIGELRPKLHRFCARMCGSVRDGEDVVQEALAQAFSHLPSLKDQSRLEPWLFRIAHHKCGDLLRQERRTGRTQCRMKKSMNRRAPRP